MSTAVYKKGNTIVIDDGVNEPVESFSAQTRFNPEYVNGVITEYNVLDAWNGNSLLAKIIASEIVDENGNPYDDFYEWKSLNTGFNTATGGSVALIPLKITGAEAESLTDKVEGMIIYSLDGSGSIITIKGWWGWDGSTWIQF